MSNTLTEAQLKEATIGKQLISIPEYARWLKELKEKITQVQVCAALAASRELILFYWDQGRVYLQKASEKHLGEQDD